MTILRDELYTGDYLAYADLRSDGAGGWVYDPPDASSMWTERTRQAR